MIEIISICVLYVLLVALGISILHNATISLVKKFFIGLVWVLALGLSAVYNYQQISPDSFFLELEGAFRGGKTLNCEGFLVNKSDFNLIGQTSMLIGKNGSPTSNIIISLEKCHIIIPTETNDDEENIDGQKIEDIQRD
ncbi:hypothetical protein [Helicobacter sp. T3_23-1059]